MRGALFATAMLFAGTAAAWADCTAVPSDLDNFGIEPLGETAPTDMDSRAARTEDCNYQTDAVCAYVDKDGVWYSLVEGVLEWKSLRLQQLRSGYRLPFGLAPTDTLAAVRMKMAGRKIALTFTPYEGHAGWTLLASDLCLVNAKHETFDVTFQFGPAGRLAVYETRIPSPRD